MNKVSEEQEWRECVVNDLKMLRSKLRRVINTLSICFAVAIFAALMVLLK